MSAVDLVSNRPQITSYSTVSILFRRWIFTSIDISIFRLTELSFATAWAANYYMLDTSHFSFMFSFASYVLLLLRSYRPYIFAAAFMLMRALQGKYFNRISKRCKKWKIKHEKRSRGESKPEVLYWKKWNRHCSRLHGLVFARMSQRETNSSLHGMLVTRCTCNHLAVMWMYGMWH